MNAHKLLIHSRKPPGAWNSSGFNSPLLNHPNTLASEEHSTDSAVHSPELLCAETVAAPEVLQLLRLAHLGDDGDIHPTWSFGAARSGAARPLQGGASGVF